MSAAVDGRTAGPVSPDGVEVGIVGGGMLGLGLALRLNAQGHRVTVIEGGPAIGGLTRADQFGGVTWDRFYHVTLLSDTYLRALLDDIGLADQMRWRTTRTGFFTDGRLISMSSALDFLRFPPLGLLSKARLAWTILAASRISDPLPLEQISSVEWLTRLSGRKTVERIWLPLLRSKLGENYRQASAAFIWAIIARLYAARRAGLHQELFGYVDGGYDVVLSRLRSAVAARGVELVCGQAVTQVLADANSATITLADGNTRRFDAAVMTVPCPRVSALCPQLSAAERNRLGRVVYQGVICPSLLLQRPLADYYVTNITDGWVPFTGVIEMTALVDPATFGGKALVYLPRYLTQDDATWNRTDEDLVAESIAALERMYPNFRREDVVASRVARAREVLAISTLDYSREALPPLRTSLDRLFIVNSAQIAHGTLNVNETLALAARQSDALATLLRTTPQRVPANWPSPSYPGEHAPEGSRTVLSAAPLHG
jgi:protoporphyrinogen oxidase